MSVTLNGRTWALSDFAPWGFRQNWIPFFEDLVAELAGFQGGILRDQAASSAASAATSAARAQTLVGQAGTGAATGLVYGAALKSLVTASDVVSVFVYDTRHDSDGGAWTEKCRGTSWYNETLNTTTRGATRRFPVVALIVARATSLTIYDAHDLDTGGVPRMWMQFNRTTGGTIVHTQPITGLWALNGNIWITQTDGSIDGGLTHIAFTDDSWTTRYDGISGRAGSGISARNSNVSRTTRLPGIVSWKCYSVHAQVLPGAPLDSAGLPIPTVAVATAGGVSVIHPWGVVADITPDYICTRVMLQKNGRLWISSAAGIYAYGAVPYADTSFASWVQKRFDPAGGFPRHISTEARTGIAVIDGLIYASGGLDDRGMSILSPDDGNPANGMIAYTARNYATGWQPGDIRGAWLCDSATGSIAGSGEFIVNGDFANGTTGWTTGNGGLLEVVSGEARLTGNGTTNYAYFQQIIPTVPGQTYLLSFSGRVASGEFGATQVLRSDTGVSLIPSQSLPGAATAQTPCMVSFEAASTNTIIRFTSSSAPSPASPRLYIDNISVCLALPDRSYKSKGLVVNGTLTRTALPCGLAAVSGFSAANYLEQPYNPDLDFGTGDFAAVAWVMLPAGQAGGAVFSRAASANPSILLAVSNTLLFRTRLDGANEMNLSAAIDIRERGWVQIVAIRRASVLELWINGVLAAQLAGSTYSLSDTSAQCRWGARIDVAQPFTGGSITLARVAAYAPTPTQIRRMYEDERALVIGGQPALLGGTSNNVTALASNPDTGSLLVGTGDGVSVFSGLARTAYHDGASAAGAVASDAITSVSAMGPHLLVGTSANAGLITEAQIGRDLMGGSPAASPPPAPAAVTTDATPTLVNPRLYVGEGETRAVRSLVTSRQYGTSAGQAAAYELRYLVRRDLGGVLTLLGTVNVTVIHETSGGMDADISIDTVAQTVTERVTGLANTRLVWTVERQVLPLTMGENYAE